MLDVMMLAPALLAVDLGGLIRGLIYLLIAALVVGIVLYIIIRLLSQFMPGFAPYAWILWAIGGLILVLIALNIFGGMIGV
jgi:hypothetical protein